MLQENKCVGIRLGKIHEDIPRAWSSLAREDATFSMNKFHCTPSSRARILRLAKSKKYYVFIHIDKHKSYLVITKYDYRQR